MDGASAFDSLVHYAERAEGVFDRLHEVCTRVAGLLMAYEMLGKRTALDTASFESAKARLSEADAFWHGLVVPIRASHFNLHLGQARVLLHETLEAMDGRLAGLISTQDPLMLARAAWRELETASKLLPGFETVDFSLSCCAMHTNSGSGGTRHGGIFNLDA